MLDTISDALIKVVLSYYFSRFLHKISFLLIGYKGISGEKTNELFYMFCDDMQRIDLFSN